MKSDTTKPVLAKNNIENSGFYSYPIAKVFSETYYKLGKDLYQNVISRMYSSDNSTKTSWEMWPAFVNIAFSCEINLKLLYQNDNKKIVRGHKLFNELFLNLSSQTKQVLSNQTIIKMKTDGSENYNIDSFYEDFKVTENTFDYERYMFECIPGNKHQLKPAFLLALAQSLINVVNQIYK